MRHPRSREKAKLRPIAKQQLGMQAQKKNSKKFHFSFEEKPAETPNALR